MFTRRDVAHLYGRAMICAPKFPMIMGLIAVLLAYGCTTRTVEAGAWEPLTVRVISSSTTLVTSATDCVASTRVTALVLPGHAYSGETLDLIAEGDHQWDDGYMYEVEVAKVSSRKQDFSYLLVRKKRAKAAQPAR